MRLRVLLAVGCVTIVAVTVAVIRMGLRAPRRPNIVLICVDALRADAISPYNPEIDHTPNLQAFAEEAVTIPVALAQSSWTMESMSSVMTSKLPGEVAADKRALSVAESEITLAELLQQQGYATAAICHPMLNERNGYAQGFDWLSNERLRQTVPEDLVRWLTEHQAEHRQKPFFLYLHYLQPHGYYRWPEEFDAIAGPPPANIRDVATKEVMDELTWALRAGEGHVTRDEAQYLWRCYGAAVAAADQAVGRVFDLLREQGLWDQSLVIVFADHGEEFAEHGYLQHSANLYREELAVPLIIKMPEGTRSRTWPRFARNLDILPTIAEAAGIEPRPEWRGVSLLSGQTPTMALAELGVRTHPNEFVASRLLHWRAVYLASGESLIENGRTGQLELYSAADLQQQNNIADENPERVQELARLLPTAENGDMAPLSDEDRDALRALGYLR